MTNGWITKDPYFNFSFKELPTNIEFLTREELNCIMELELPIGSSIEQVRDIFVFCAFTGLAYIDVKTLQDNGHKSVKMTERYAKVLILTLKNDMKMVDKVFGNAM